MAYGPEARRQKKSLGDLSPKTTVQSINGVHLTSVSMVIGADGQPLYEQYAFMAKDLNGNIHKNLVNTTGGALQPNDFQTLRLGMNNDRVKVLQSALNVFLAQAASESPAFEDLLITQLNALQISTDGDFGPKTKKTVEIFQEYNHLGVDGVVGKLTWAQLEEYI